MCRFWVLSNTESLSARRAWIEIFIFLILSYEKAVALRKESVDRNVFIWLKGEIYMESLSARRAWIEMSGRRQAHTSPKGSLSARRAWIEIQ